MKKKIVMLMLAAALAATAVAGCSKNNTSHSKNAQKYVFFIINFLFSSLLRVSSIIDPL